MADRLTQLQDSIDDLFTQFYASLNYVYNRAPYGEIPGQPPQAPQGPSQTAPNSAAPVSAGGALTNGDVGQAQTNGEAKKDAGDPIPDTPAAFRSALHQMARDLILTEQRAEILINSLPGIGNSEQDQERRMRELEVELRRVEADRAKAEDEREKMVDVLGEMLVGVRRVG